MRSFKDTTGRTWELSITVGSARRVRDLLKINLYNLIDEGAKKLGELFDDPITFTEVVYHLCKQSATITPEEFCESFNGDTLAASAEAFFEELVDFFPDPKARTGLRNLKTKSKLLQAKLLEQTQAKLEALNLNSLAESLSASSGNSPARSESTPTPSLSGNSV